MQVLCNRALDRKRRRRREIRAKTGERLASRSTSASFAKADNTELNKQSKRKTSKIKARQNRFTLRLAVKFLFPQFTTSSCFIPFTGLDELGKLACSQCMGTAALTQKPWVFFGLICNCLDCNYHCDAINLYLNLYFRPVHIIFMFHSFQ